MLLDFRNLYKKYNLNINGLIHIGGHYGEEFEIYKEFDIKNILFFEPVPESFNILSRNVGEYNNVIIENTALGNFNGKIKMNIERSNNSQSSSCLTPKKHIQLYPHIIFDNVIEVDIMRLDDYLFNNKIKYNFINIDVQGYELEVFKGASNTLKNIDYIITEVNYDEVYENCVIIDELDDFLKQYGFKRVENNKDGIIWGDSFYIKQ